MTVLLSALLLAACGSSGHQSSATTSPAGTSPAGSGSAAVIVIKNFAYSPSSLTVAPGSTVTVRNSDTATHTVTSTNNGAFDTGDIQPGGSETFKAPSTPGSYPYICSIHQFMHGTLVVH